MTTEQISELRASIDGLSKVVALDTHSFAVGSKTYASKDHLIRAKRWLGLVLNERGNPNPYKGSYATVAEIVPETDLVFIEDPAPKTEDEVLMRLQAQRGYLGTIIDNVKVITGSTRLESVAWTQVYVSLCDAKMALGEALGVLRDGQ